MLIQRPNVFKSILNHLNKSPIKILTGIRRCGKSSMLFLLKDYLINSGVHEDNILHINFEINEYEFSSYIDLINYVKNKIKNKNKYYLLFDEIQVIDSWQKAIESIRLSFDTDIYITGSNGYLLSSDLTTYLTGRYVELKVYPLSYKEFKTFYNTKLNKNDSDDKIFFYFSKYGGMPSLFEYDFTDDNPIRDLLEGIFNTIINKDIQLRNDININNTFIDIIKLLASNIGNITSINNIKNILNNEKKQLATNKASNISHLSIENYLSYLINAFLFIEAHRYDISGKKLLSSTSKIYLTDIGLRYILLSNNKYDRGHVLENIIFIDLVSRKYKVYVGKTRYSEVDFVAIKGDIIKYIQVTESLDNPEVFKREVSSLLAIKDAHEKIIITKSYYEHSNFQGVKIVQLYDFLLNDDF